MSYDTRQFVWSIIVAVLIVGGILGGAWMIGSAIAFSNQQAFDQQVACIKAGGSPIIDQSHTSGVQCRK